MLLGMEARSSGKSCECNQLIYAPRHLASYFESALRQQQPPSQAKRGRARWVEPRPRGLWNSGQSCHLGAAVVALSAVPVLREWLRQQETPYRSPFALVKHYLLEAAPSSGYRRALDPRPVLSMLEQAGWKSRHAQDAHETMARLLEILEDWSVLNSTGNAGQFRMSSEGLNGRGVPLCLARVQPARFHSTPRWGRIPFSALNASSSECHTCGYVSSVSFQPNFLLTLPVPGFEQTLSELLVNTYMSAEKIEMRCDQCLRLGVHTWSSNIKRFPEMLVVHLQKAIYLLGGVGASDRRVSLSRRLEIPVKGSDGNITRIERYTLRSVVRHRGNANSRNSHFDAVLGQPCSSVRDGLLALASLPRWWHVDDDFVSHCDDGLALNPLHAYLVIYDSQRTVPMSKLKLEACRA